MHSRTKTEFNHITASAIQLEAVVGDVAANLERAEHLCLEAVSKGAKLIALPEFFTSRLPFDEGVHEAVLPRENEAVDMLKALASKHEVWIGGSMLIADGPDVFNRYHFVEPNGTVHYHDKDLPTMWENAFYTTGNDDGAFETGVGNVGAAVCWELIRSQTVRRLQGRVEVAMTGTHWWSIPTNWGSAVYRSLAAIGQYTRYMSENAPAELARRLGVPVIQSAHCGKFRSRFMLVPGSSLSVPYDTEYDGCTQIVDASGHVLAQRQTQEGPGVVVADITIGAVDPVRSIEDKFWLPSLPMFIKAYWHHQNMCGKSYYRRKGRRAGIESAKRRRVAQRSDST